MSIIKISLIFFIGVSIMFGCWAFIFALANLLGKVFERWY